MEVDLLNNLLELFHQWIKDKNDIYISETVTAFNSYFKEFCENKTKFICQRNELLENYYYQEIIDLYCDFKTITSGYTSFLFHNKNDTADDLFYFLSNYAVFEEELIEEENDEDFHEIVE
jgi:hypothetical protein